MVGAVSKAFPVCYDLIFHHGEMYFDALSQSYLSVKSMQIKIYVDLKLKVTTC